ncbi:Gmad2 immunoglobulin-like domain-containing protein [Patescibacteria group bacterium]|nr:Gmad2 immunoglobulin-like domain-containing protein [Patescibacteria group bacterium]
MSKTTKKSIILLLAVVVLSGCTGSDNVINNVAPQNNTSLTIDDGTLSSQYSIRLTSPQEGQVLKSPFLVGGEANIPSDIIYVRVKNPSGDIIIEEQTRVNEGAFGVLLTFLFQATDSGTVEVYGIDPSANKEVSLQSVEVNFDTSSSGNTQNPL